MDRLCFIDDFLVILFNLTLITFKSKIGEFLYLRYSETKNEGTFFLATIWQPSTTITSNSM